MPEVQDQLRPPDAGTTDRWSFIDTGRVYVWRHGLPSVLGRPQTKCPPLIAISPQDNGGSVVTLTAHQARALMEILPAAVALADTLEDE